MIFIPPESIVSLAVNVNVNVFPVEFASVLVGETTFVPEPSAACTDTPPKKTLSIINPTKMTILSSGTPFLWDIGIYLFTFLLFLLYQVFNFPYTYQ